MWQAARAVRTELAAALGSARAGAAAALASAEESDGRLEPAELARIVAAFDGNRHIRAELRGTGAAFSHLAPPAHTPAWFLAAVSPDLPRAVLPAGGGTLVLAADPANEAFERWSAMREELALLGLFSLLAGLLCSVTASRALHPLLALSGGLARLGLGERDVQVAEGGPPEIAALAASFNALSSALQAARDQNRQLQVQASLLAEEERVEIARELHDEVGPLLFAITAFAATIGRLAAEGDLDAILSQVAELQAAASATQREVRNMLGRLHDVSPGAPGLACSLGGLLDFWRRVRPETVFSLEGGDGEIAFGQDAEEALFRVAQEGDVQEAADGDAALAAASRLRPDLVILDLGLPGQGGLAVLPRLAQAGLRVLVLTMHAEPVYARRALDAGAAGYASKNIDPDALLDAVRLVLAGKRFVEPAIAQALAVMDPSKGLAGLTARDLEIMRLLAAGRGMSDIAASLEVSYKTIANTASALRAKLGVARTADLIRLAIEMRSR